MSTELAGAGPGQQERPRRSAGWRVATPVAFALAGLLAITSMVNSHGTDLRVSDTTSLVQVVGQQRAQVEALERRSKLLQSQVEQLSKDVGGAKVGALQRRVQAMKAPSGLSPVAGPGIVVTLNDAPYDEPVPDGASPDLLVVHQQDIQAVVNALWAGGAKGVSVQGQRIISTTGIKCVGNTVVLQGVPYSPPYVIAGVGNARAMYDALLASPGVRAYREYVPPPYNLGWALKSVPRLTVPAYTGPLALTYATD